MSQIAVYWDASAILSLLTEDEHSEDALSWFYSNSIHLLSTLAYSETLAVVWRLCKENLIFRKDAANSINFLCSAPWKRLNIGPEWNTVSRLSECSGLRGADLWHLSLALTLRSRHISPLHLLTYDTKLRDAAKMESLCHCRVNENGYPEQMQ